MVLSLEKKAAAVSAFSLPLMLKSMTAQREWSGSMILFL
jgi:hypothetical protein